MRCSIFVLSAVFLTSCLRETCEPGAERACFTGPGLADTGVCRSGTQACDPTREWGACAGEVVATEEFCNGADEDCDGVVDNGAANVCGGCSVPMGSPGASCRRDDGCPGTWTCEGGDLVCAGPARNACGVCGGPEITGKGDACTASDGCTGQLACNTAGDAVMCVAAPKNACGVCGGPSVAGLGGSCVDGDGCAGTLACDGAGRATRCAAAGVNDCGVCNGPPVTGVGGSCAANGCTGTVACTAGGTTACNAPSKNGCGVCGGAAVTGLGASCVADNGCAGTVTCASGGNATFCQAPAKNACGVCGGAAVPDGWGCDGGPAHPACLGPATGLPVTSKPRANITATGTTLACSGGGLSCAGATTLTKARCRDGFAFVLVDGNATVNVRFRAEAAGWTAGATMNGTAIASGAVSVSGLRPTSDPVPQPGMEHAADFFLSVGASTLEGGVVARW